MGRITELAPLRPQSQRTKLCNRTTRVSVPLPLLVTILLSVHRLWAITNAAGPSLPFSNKLPEASSSLLRIHKIYSQQPPHDTRLYDVLSVGPNATAIQITKSYRKLSRKLHPDKARDMQTIASSSEILPSLHQVQEAYDILRNDRTRLLYHKYGLLDISQALALLTKVTGSSAIARNRNSVGINDESIRELLLLMGFDDDDEREYDAHESLLCTDDSPSGSTLDPKSRQKRIAIVASRLVEQLRPVVEGVLSEQELAHDLVTYCDRLKGLPFGAQILRCIGRAYRYSGQKVLHQDKRSMERDIEVSEHVREKLRDARHLLDAAFVGSRAVVAEELSERLQKRRQKRERRQKLTYYNKESEEEEHEALGGLDDSILNNDAIKELEQAKVQNALLESLQLDALWKICKIDLDRTIRHACDLIFDPREDFFFFPSLQSARPDSNSERGTAGWVGSSGRTITTEEGRMRAASALIMMGNVMVKRSKEGTAWKQ